MTQTEIANFLSIDQPEVCRWENNCREPTVKHIKILSECWGVSVDMILCRDILHYNDLAKIRYNHRKLIRCLLELSPDQVERIKDYIKVIKKEIS